MNRKEFLAQLGLVSGTGIVISCLQGCAKEQVNAPTHVNFALDMNLPANAALSQNGGYVYSNGIIVARTISGALIAVSHACTHQGVTVVYDKQNNIMYCPAHGSAFSTTGAVVNGPANAALTQYNVAVNGNIITITG
jgi:cytochrome b6-f complex iron-sulfur subunit